MKIYTKTGDKGETSLLNGGRVPKFHERIEAYGTVDELSSFIGFLKTTNTDYIEWLTKIQEKLLLAGSELSAVDDTNLNITKINKEDIEFLETKIDYLEKDLAPLKEFILPGKNEADAICHICRTACRRAERRVVKLSQTDKINTNIIKYLNRLSDFFFVLSRKF